MSGKTWLSLMEYSGKYRVSLSTLRRRIKAGEVEYKLTAGKYLLEDQPLTSGSEVVAPPPKTQPQNQGSKNESIEMLLQEIKKAYALILQEKEEQILQLRDEVADLKTLVRVLEQNAASPAPVPKQEPRHVALSEVNPDFDLDLDLGLEIEV